MKLAAAYLLLLIYATLFPLSGWDGLRGGLHNLFPVIWPTQISRSDVITNLVVYLPLGLLLMLSWRPRYGAWFAIALATLVGSSLSFGLNICKVIFRNGCRRCSIRPSIALASCSAPYSRNSSRRTAIAADTRTAGATVGSYPAPCPIWASPYWGCGHSPN